MIQAIVNRKHSTLLALVMLSLPVVSFAQPTPDELMDRLRSANGDEAKRIAQEVEMAWSRSGSPAMDLLLKRGREAIQKGDFAAAVNHLTALTDHAPDFAEGFHARAEAYFRLELYGPALDDLEIALALNPQHYEAIFGLGVMFQEFGRLRDAADLYRRVLTLHPNHENAANALSRLKRDGIGREL
ncbi:MAG: tetratricopeptide repeat protein [Pseudomonadota bacterium]